jgi:hypothetical protein
MNSLYQSPRKRKTRLSILHDLGSFTLCLLACSFSYLQRRMPFNCLPSSLSFIHSFKVSFYLFVFLSLPFRSSIRSFSLSPLSIFSLVSIFAFLRYLVTEFHHVSPYGPIRAVYPFKKAFKCEKTNSELKPYNQNSFMKLIYESC